MGKVGVIAGTPVDMRMGIEFVTSHGMVALGRFSSSTPQEQTKMQSLSPQELTEQIIRLSRELIVEGVNKVLIYCNSLSSAIDLQGVRDGIGIPVITPLDVYKEVAKRYQKVAVIAANGQSLAGIERIFQQANPDCLVIGAGLLSIVIAIEQRVPPEEIVNQYGLHQVIDGLTGQGTDALILGCTHFPYLAPEVVKFCRVEVIEPSRRMIGLLASPSSNP